MKDTIMATRLVPTLCVGMPSSTLRVALCSTVTINQPPSCERTGFTTIQSGESIEEDAERPGRHSHAERGNEL
jgi:hypothetical protein